MDKDFCFLSGKRKTIFQKIGKSKIYNITPDYILMAKFYTQTGAVMIVICILYTPVTLISIHIVVTILVIIHATSVYTAIISIIIMIITLAVGKPPLQVLQFAGSCWQWEGSGFWVFGSGTSPTLTC